eukprot:COSAG01_NODE_44279_length_420_cov_3.149533_1_plen_96_part_00
MYDVRLIGAEPEVELRDVVPWSPLHAVATHVMVAANPVPRVLPSDVNRTRIAEPVAVAASAIEVPLRGLPIWLSLSLLPSSAYTYTHIQVRIMLK